MVYILKYVGQYQVTYEYELTDKGYQFINDKDSTYIVLRKGQIYRWDGKTLVLRLEYDTIIKTPTTETKEPLRSVFKAINKTIDIVDHTFLDDCILISFNEKDLHTIMNILNDNKLGCYQSRINRSPKSIKNLLDYEVKRKTMEEISHTKLYEKLKSNMKDKPVSDWNKLYKNLNEKLNVDIKNIAEENGIRPINIIDNKNWYKHCFEILKI